MQIKNLFGNDLSLTSQGVLEMSDGEELTQESIIRRLLTNPGTYFWHPEYGAGISRFVGESLSTGNFDYIQNIITSQILLESTVAQTPRPLITFKPLGNNILQCDIVYYSALTKNPVSISFQVS